jgi:hypothetical protein
VPVGVLATAAAAAGDTPVVGAVAAVAVEGVVLWLVAAAAAAAGIHVKGIQLPEADVDRDSVVVADHVVVGVVAGEAPGLGHCRVGRRVDVERRREVLVQEGSSLLL